MMANSQIGPSCMMLDDLVPQPSDPEHMMVDFDQPQEPDYLLVGFDEPGLTPCFSQFNLNPLLLQGLSEATDITAPTQLQSDFLWLILGRPFKNLVLVSPMGSGKTMCALLAVLKRVNTAKLATQSIIVCPSGELSEQIRLVINLDVPENAKIYSKRMAGVGGENGGGVVFSLCGGVMERERMSLIEDEMDLLVDDVTWMGEEELEHLARTWYKRRSPAW